MMNENGTEEKTQDTPPHIQLDCCEVCNDTLNKHFEQPFMELVKGAFAGNEQTRSESESVSIWLLKTLLLMTHPSRKKGWNVNEIAWDSRSTDPNIYRWMTNSAAPPDGLSLFIHHFSSSMHAAASITMKLPRLIWSTTERRSQSALIGLNQWGFTLVHHPGWKFTHPLEGDPTLKQLWPPQEAINFMSIPLRSDWPLEFQEEQILLSGHPKPDLELPPLTITTRFNKIEGYTGSGSSLPTEEF
ncbi:hypothetical protein [Glutamicibacter protophormiae]